MRIPRRGLLTLAAIAGAGMTLLAPSAASAAYYGSETNFAAPATRVDVDQVFRCTSITGVYVCYEGLHDFFWVKDEKADGYSAAIDWFDAEGTRWGSCVNKHGKSDGWTACNKNLPEGHLLYIRAARYDSGNPVDHGNWITAYA
jgi:hypothetical protein